MQAMVLEKTGTPLVWKQLPEPRPSPGQVLIKIHACAVCRTDLHIVEGDLDLPRLPVIPGHEIVGEILALGKDVKGLHRGDRVGVPWLGSTCGHCGFCARDQENLCDGARFTGYHMDGGYAEYTVADSRFVFPLPAGMNNTAAAPLLCAGLIGFRSLRMAGDAERLGVYGFGAAAHIVSQVARYQGRSLYAFTRPGDKQSQAFARDLGACWAGDSDQLPPEPLDAAIIYAPVGGLVPAALRAVRKGGSVICAGIHMSDIPSFPYTILWGERSIRSVANLTRRDGEEFLKIAAEIPVRTVTQCYPLVEANKALDDLRHGRLTGAAVLVTGK